MGVSTNGAASMTSYRFCVVAKKIEVPHKEMVFIHCIIDREHLASKKLSPDLKDVLTNAVKIANEIRNPRKLQILLCKAFAGYFCIEIQDRCFQTEAGTLRFSCAQQRCNYKCMFSILNEHLTSVDVNDKKSLSIGNQHLKELADTFDQYFPEHKDPRHRNLWINNSFIEDVNTCDLNLHEQENLIDFCCDFTLQLRCKKESLSQF